MNSGDMPPENDALYEDELNTFLRYFSPSEKFQLFEIITPTSDEYDIYVIPPDGTFPGTFISAKKFFFQNI